jgi:hypothetical protein
VPIVSFGVRVTIFRVAADADPARFAVDTLTVCGPDGAEEEEEEMLRTTMAPQPASRSAAQIPWTVRERHRVTFTRAR